MNILEELRGYSEREIDEAIEVMKEKCRPVGAGTAQSETDKQVQYNCTVGEIQEEILKLCSLCLTVSQKYETDCFFRFEAHVKCFIILIYPNGWIPDADPGKYLYIDLNEPCAIQEITNCRRYIESLIQEEHNHER